MREKVLDKEKEGKKEKDGEKEEKKKKSSVGDASVCRRRQSRKIVQNIVKEGRKTRRGLFSFYL